MLERVLIANRAEIGVRIARTLRTMGIRSVLLASYPDRRSLAARTCDEVVVLDGSTAADTYLDIAEVIGAAQRTGCDAIHPGYGFLSENPAFAEACRDAGITFIGPPPEVLRLLGDKAAARQLAVREGIPVVPGYDGADTDEALTSAAEAIGYPVMIKARGGGGGRGMRRVHAPAELPEAIASARREAQAAFGDPGLLLERLVEGAHHVEVQILADSHGNVVHLGERECSVQRRHQKLIEEAPSPNVDAALRERLTDAALRLARAAGVVNAATVEFLLLPARDGDEAEFFFIEVNPRLQVEHPVTEEITRIDIVEQQIRIAAGEPLSFGQDEVRFSGHAIECRINAEDPAQGFRPSSGLIERQEVPSNRADFGYTAGDLMPTAYDSLVGKVVEASGSREDAVIEIRSVLHDLVLEGLTTNQSLLCQILGSRAFQFGTWTVSLLDEEINDLLATPGAIWAVSAAAAALSSAWESPWHQPLQCSPVASRLGGAQGGVDVLVERLHGPTARRVTVGRAEPVVATPEGKASGYEMGRWVIMHPTLAARQIRMAMVNERTRRVATFEGYGASGTFRVLPPLPSGLRPPDAGGSLTAPIVAPLSGTIASVAVESGQTVSQGDLLVLLEAMKMEHRIEAATGGTVETIHFAAGDVVREGDVLVTLTAAPTS